LKKIRLLTCIFLVMMLIFTGCSKQQTETSEPGEKQEEIKPIVMKVGGISPPTATVSMASEKMCELVEQKSDGRLKLEFYPAQQLGGPEAQLENLRSGVQDILIVAGEWAATMEKDFNIMAMPYVFKDVEHISLLFESEKGKAMFQRLIDNFGIRVIGYDWWRLPRTIISVKEVTKPEDVVGIKFRVPDIPIMIEHVKQLEASPTPVSWTELYMALKQGVAMAENCTLETIYPNKFHEAAPYIADLNFAYSNTMAFMAEDSYQKLSPELQGIIVEAAKEAGQYYNEITQASWETDKLKIEEEGGIFVDADWDAFAAKVLPMADRLEKEGLWSEGLADYVVGLK
jgi:tripartite ATP-independent transporter DctP family solute receptor